MITLDKTCRDIVANFLSEISQGKLLKYSWKNKMISKAEYYDSLFGFVDNFISNEEPSSIEEIFHKQKYYEFNPHNQLHKLVSCDASCIIEPLIIKRIDSEGNIHYMCATKFKQGDTILKKLPFNPCALDELYNLLSSYHYYTAGLNVGLNNILCFGVSQEAVIAYRKNLINSIEGGR